ncbi:biopolymer transporter ExbD [Pleurocapsa sp. PCC 7319]|uniref:ExbD/TolR family protein n=1 Tax=Pleurocapsa sp. PCC 7319 TaxID=118161 RepID=UPI000475AB68|nr:biopolymer transporter ExbD [Pleurocapsa sp. PCC 7319]
MTSKKKYQPRPIKPMKLWQDEGESSGANIEILPLIDVIFCILTFFILAAVNFSRQQAISLDLPQAKTGAPQMQNILIVTIDDIGQLYVDQNLVSRSDLAWEIKKYRQSNPDGLMTLYAAKNSTYREVVEVLDILREVGGNRVALATLPEGSAPPTIQPTPGVNPALPGLPNSIDPFPNPPAPPTP